MPTTHPTSVHSLVVQESMAGVYGGLPRSADHPEVPLGECLFVLANCSVAAW